MAGTDLRRDPARPLASSTDQAAYRILQEALTNAARRGAGTAHIDIRQGNNALNLTVTNPIPGTDSSRRGGDHGIVGMEERATALGGTVAPIEPGRNFVVRASLPGQEDRTRPPWRSLTTIISFRPV